MFVPKSLRNLLSRIVTSVVRLERRWILGVAYAIILAALVTRGPLTRPGLVEWTADLSIHYDIRIERGFWQSAWHPYIFDTDRAATLPMLSSIPFF
jgi:hypothetical protein